MQTSIDSSMTFSRDGRSNSVFDNDCAQATLTNNPKDNINNNFFILNVLR